MQIKSFIAEKENKADVWKYKVSFLFFLLFEMNE